MPFEIFPQSITLYPEDVQTFTSRTTFPPILWNAFTHGTIQADGTVNLSAVSGDSSLIVAAALEGVAGIRWTFDSRMLPTSTGNIFFLITGAGSHSLRVRVYATSTEVTDENNNSIATISRTVASGDIYYLEVAGNMLRLYINGSLSAEYEASTSVRYPLRARVDTTPNYVSGTPHLTVPELVGNWGANPDSTVDMDWTIAPSSGGTFAAATDVWSVVFTASDQPGVYTIEAQVGGSSLQEATATAIVAPLSILGETTVTLQPGEVVTFKTNYDNAQRRLITWSVVSGGGSFSNGQYTAPTAPATPILKAVYGNQEARINVTVPAVMTIKTAANEDVTAAKLGEVLTLSTNIASGTINWTASVGTLSSSTGSTVTWTAPNQSQLVGLITATNGTYTVTAEIPVLKEFPYRASRPAKWDARKTVLVSRAEDRTRAARVKDAGNESFEAFELTFINRTLAEVDAVRAFWDDHHPQKKFIFTDHHRSSIRKVVYFDSDITNQGDATCATTYSVRVIEA